MSPEERDTRGSGAAPSSDSGGETQLALHSAGRDPYQVRAKHLLKMRALWAIPVIVGSILMVLMTVFYIGSVVNPVGHLRGLPVSIVNEDAGATIGAPARRLRRAAAVGTDRLARRLEPAVADPRATAAAEGPDGPQRRLRHRGDPTGLHRVAALADGASAAGGDVCRQAHGPTARQPACRHRRRRAGQRCSRRPRSRRPHTGSVSQLLAATRSAPPSRHPRPPRCWPIRSPSTSVDYRPLPSHSALGLSAFYIALLTLMCGFLAATIINVTVDAATGYATSEIGPKWRQRAPLPINRWHTLLTKWTMALPMTALLTGLMLAVAIGLLGMDAPNAGYLWLFTWLAAASVAAGTLVLFAVLGTQGQLLALLLFVYLGLASAGGTVPLQALPGALKLVSQIEPFRQILSGTRSILYFNAAGDAGLTRGIITATAGLIFWLALGTTVVRWYDRKGLHRLTPTSSTTFSGRSPPTELKHNHSPTQLRTEHELVV